MPYARRFGSIFSFVLCAFLLCACAAPNPQHLSDTPDLSAFHTVEIQTNAADARRETVAAYFVPLGAYLELESGAGRLYVQVEQCGNDADPLCQRRYMLSGDISLRSTPLKCYVQIRNDANSGYAGQALQGLCQDSYRRSYSITVSK